MSWWFLLIVCVCWCLHLYMHRVLSRNSIVQIALLMVVINVHRLVVRNSGNFQKNANNCYPKHSCSFCNYQQAAQCAFLGYYHCVFRKFFSPRMLMKNICFCIQIHTWNLLVNVHEKFEWGVTRLCNTFFNCRI